MAGDANVKELVIICICTCGRPKMLRECIQAFASLKPVEAWPVEIIVVDNNLVAMPSGDHAKLQALVDLPLHVVREEEPGIPFARNRALKQALALQADWIAFLDDDEIIDAFWLIKMHEASLAYEADILHGWTRSSPPENVISNWLPAPARNKRPTGTQLATAATDNVLFRSKVALSPPRPLWFDEQMRFLGGEDIDFFYEAVERGFRIVWIPEATASEIIPPQRLTFSYQVNRSRSAAVAHVYINLKRKGLLSTLKKQGVKATGRLFGGLLGLLLAPFMLLKGRKAFFRSVLHSGKKVYYAAGVFGYFLKIRPEIYRQIQGQ